tara:strand:+ start:1566 stop:2216 length:651 start_codon:yes stop_codon:yes gene_type:complete
VKECKKILLISKPRGGSTVFLDLLHYLCGVTNVYNEPGIPQEYEVFESLSIKDELLVKIIVSNEKERTNKFIKKVDWDKIIMIHRNDNDAMLSMSHQYINSDFQNKLTFEDNSNRWRSNYKQNKDIKIPKWIQRLYKELELRFEEILGMNDNIIELTYENLYHKDRSIRRSELDKILDTNDIHWLVLKNVLDKLDPILKYTSKWNESPIDTNPSII